MTRPAERELQEEERGSAKALRQQRIWLVGKGRRKPEQLSFQKGFWFYFTEFFSLWIDSVSALLEHFTFFGFVFTCSALFSARVMFHINKGFFIG